MSPSPLTWLRRALALALLSSPVLASSLVLGSKDFTEQRVLSSITAQYLDHNGYQVEEKTDLGSVIMREAQINKQVDLVWEYTGTVLVIYDNNHTRMTPEQAYATVKQLDAPRGLTWLNPSKLNDTYALAMTQKSATQDGIKTISDLVRHMDADQAKKPWQLGFDIEFVGRSDGLKPMQALYKMQLTRPQIRQMDAGLVYNALRDNYVDAGLVYTTDARVKGFDLAVLQDDLHYFPSYAATPVVRSEILAKNPGLAALLNKLSALLDNPTMVALNAKVDLDHRTAADVAHEFLHTHGLI
jgi:osmoprotectant transport system substrate-binding protein